MSRSRRASPATPVAVPGGGEAPIVKWHDEQTQQAPLVVEAAQLASSDEIELALAGQVWAGRDQLAGRVSHWMSNHILLAVVDTSRWRVAIRPQVARLHIGQAAFVGRPPTAATPPDGFRVMPMDDLLWKYGLHGERSPGELPNAYLDAPVELLRIPQLSPGLLAPRHLTLMRLLGQETVTFEALRVRLGANADDLLRDFVALYLTRALALRKPERG